MSISMAVRLPFASNNGDRRLRAKDLADFNRSIYSDGISPINAAGMQVTALENMTLHIQPGRILIDGHLGGDDSPIALTLEPANGSLARIDRIVARYDDVARDMVYAVKKGIAASTPVPVEMEYSELIKERVLADVLVAAAVTEITQADITDRRPNSELCGIAAALMPINADALFAQWAAAAKESQEGWEAEFEELLGQMHDLIDEETAGHLLNMINSLSASVDARFAGVSRRTGTSWAITVPITGWEYNSSFDRYEVTVTVEGMTAGAMAELVLESGIGAYCGVYGLDTLDDAVVLYANVAATVAGTGTLYLLEVYD